MVVRTYSFYTPLRELMFELRKNIVTNKNCLLKNIMTNNPLQLFVEKNIVTNNPLQLFVEKNIVTNNSLQLFVEKTL